MKIKKFSKKVSKNLTQIHIDLLNDFENAKKAIKKNTDYTDILKNNIENMKNELEEIEKQKMNNYEKWKNNELTEIEYMENIKNSVTQECYLQKTIRDKKNELTKARLEKQNIKDPEELNFLLN